ncbi:MAG: hypothetical protein AB4050_17200 [Synechococcus sp.]
MQATVWENRRWNAFTVAILRELSSASALEQPQAPRASDLGTMRLPFDSNDIGCRLWQMQNI